MNLVTTALIFTLAPNAGAQTIALPTQHGPEFEVATVKPVDPNTPHNVGVNIYPGGRVLISGVPLRTLVATAFHLSYWQISGGDAWTEKDNYDVEAKPPESLRSTILTLRYSWYGIEDEHLRQMLQALLIDRFQLKFHRETKTGKVYLLKRNGKTLRLRAAEMASAGTNRSQPAGQSGEVEFVGGRWFLFNTSMPQLAKFAADHALHAPVIDRTDLNGSFDYKEPDPLVDPEAGHTEFADNFLRLIQELGLELERATGPVETFVIDRVEKPSAN